MFLKKSFFHEGRPLIRWKKLLVIFKDHQVITSQLDINIHKITISSDKGIFDGTIELRVHDRSEVKVIVDSLMKIEDLKEVQRIL